MPKKLKVNIILSLAALLLPSIAGIILWNRLPDTVPIHWNTAGEIDGYGSRLFLVAGLPALFIFFQFIFYAMIVYSSKKDPESEFGGLIIVSWLMPLILGFTSAYIYAGALGVQVSSEIIPAAVTCFTFLIAGFILWRYPSLKVVNFPTKCIATRKFTGVLIMAASAVSVVISLFRLYYLLFFISVLLVIIPIIYHFVRGRHIG